MSTMVAFGLTLTASACYSVGDAPEEHAHTRPDDPGAVPLYDNLGAHGHEITTSSDDARAYFDQGLRLQFAFNHAEAIESYLVALSHDDGCAMCWWGIALAYGPNINGTMDAASGASAYEAIGEAQAHSGGTTDVEKALIQALAERYGADPEAARTARDSSYAGAMAVVADRFGADDDVLTLYAAALMNLRPWDYWAGEYSDRVPNPGTERILEVLQSALELDDRNPGACHYYIHAVEAAYPERAEPCADRLAELMPGAGHIVHMPGHIYIRVGRYREAVTLNEHAVHSDETYIADQNPMGVYPAAYYPHNYHFMAFAATMAGMSDKAMEASIIVSPKIPKEVALQVAWIQNAIVFPHLTGVTFGRWDEVLGLAMPDPDLHQATGLAHYARGVALAATGDPDGANRELRALRAVIADTDPDGENPVLAIALHALMGEIGLRAGDAARAITHFGAATELEDAMTYDEPPLWYYPMRHSLGQALLVAGRAAEAEQTYRHDLARFPANGWSLFGLARSLEAQGKDATTTRAQFEDAWRDADVVLTGSRF
ncbi:MAG: tetratricopeptide repeat protein [Gemmatimonadota bacterium]